MTLLYLILALYLTYDTVAQGRKVWLDGNKGGGIILVILAVSFPILFVLLLKFPK